MGDTLAFRGELKGKMSNGKMDEVNIIMDTTDLLMDG